MPTLKPFERFSHSGVRQDLEWVMSCFGAAEYEFGSSGEGELTIRKDRTTAYVRKYKRQLGWRVVVQKNSKLFPEKLFDDREEVLGFLRISGL